LLWRLLVRLEIPGAWLAAGIFALHPVQVESVAWITERKNVLMGFFFLLTMLEWLRFVEPKTAHPWRNYILALVFYALSLSAKTTACTLPVALLLVLWLKKMPLNRLRLCQVAPFLLMGVGMGLVTVWWERFHQGTQGKLFEMGWMDRLLLANRALWFYMGKLLWPANLTFSYPHWTISGADAVWVLATALLAAAIYATRRWVGRSVEVGALYYALTLSPMLGFVMLYTFQYSFVADHYQYMAVIGPFALLAALIDRQRQMIRLALSGIMLVTMGVLTWRQCEMYSNLEVLWETTAERNPSSWLARNELGTLFLNQGDAAEALDQFQKALGINHHLTGTHYNIGLILAQKGDLEGAAAEYDNSISLDPNNARAHVNLGIILLQKGDLDGAIAQFRTAVDLEPRAKTWRDNLNLALARKAGTGHLKQP
jgi:tetratricopeptide (TPR) repeat protein